LEKKGNFISPTVGFRCVKDLPPIEELKKEKDRKIFLTNIAQ